MRGTASRLLYILTWHVHAAGYGRGIVQRDRERFRIRVRARKFRDGRSTHGGGHSTVTGNYNFLFGTGNINSTGSNNIFIGASADIVSGSNNTLQASTAHVMVRHRVTGVCTSPHLTSILADFWRHQHHRGVVPRFPNYGQQQRHGVE